MIAVVMAMLALTFTVGALESDIPTVTESPALSEAPSTAEPAPDVTEAPAITEPPVPITTEVPAVTESKPAITEPPIVTDATDVTDEPEPPIEDDEPEYIPPTPDTSAPGLTVPDKESLTDTIVGWLDKLDEDLSGIELWETAKAWILTNLDTVVGAILAFITLIVGLATKFSFVPKIVKKVQQLFSAIGTWYDENTTEIKNIIQAFSDFCSEMRTITNKVAAQSEENLALRQRLVEVEEDYIKAKEESTRVQQLLLDYTKLSAEEFQTLVQTSDLTKADLDRHYETYKEKVALIEAAAEGSDKK